MLKPWVLAIRREKREGDKALADSLAGIVQLDIAGQHDFLAMMRPRTLPPDTERARAALNRLRLTSPEQWTSAEARRNLKLQAAACGEGKARVHRSYGSALNAATLRGEPPDGGWQFACEACGRIFARSNKVAQERRPRGTSEPEPADVRCDPCRQAAADRLALPLRPESRAWWSDQDLAFQADPDRPSSLQRRCASCGELFPAKRKWHSERCRSVARRRTQ